MTYRTSSRQTRTASGPRANKFAGPCASCGVEVPVGAGILTGGQRSGWKVTHAPRHWVGVPCGGEMIGKPGMGRWVGGCPEKADAAEAAPDEAAPDEAALAEARAIVAEHGGDVEHLAGIIMMRERVLAATVPAQAELVWCEADGHSIQPHALAGDCEHPHNAGVYAPDGRSLQERTGLAPLDPDSDLRELSRMAGGKYAFTSSGARMTMSSRRCEDAPCCGCCD